MRPSVTSSADGDASRSSSHSSSTCASASAPGSSRRARDAARSNPSAPGTPRARGRRLPPGRAGTASARSSSRTLAAAAPARRSACAARGARRTGRARTPWPPRRRRVGAARRAPSARSSSLWRSSSARSSPAAAGRVWPLASRGPGPRYAPRASALGRTGGASGVDAPRTAGVGVPRTPAADGVRPSRRRRPRPRPRCACLGPVPRRGRPGGCPDGPFRRPGPATRRRPSALPAGPTRPRTVRDRRATPRRPAPSVPRPRRRLADARVRRTVTRARPLAHGLDHRHPQPRPIAVARLARPAGRRGERGPASRCVTRPRRLRGAAGARRLPRPRRLAGPPLPPGRPPTRRPGGPPRLPGPPPTAARPTGQSGPPGRRRPTAPPRLVPRCGRRPRRASRVPPRCAHAGSTGRGVGIRDPRRAPRCQCDPAPTPSTHADRVAGRRPRPIAMRTARKSRTTPPKRGPSREIRRRPTLPGSLPPSTIGAGGLNFRVRNGNGCDPAAIATEICCQRRERQMALGPLKTP